MLAYLAVGIVEPLIPTYQAELSPAPLRGFFAGNVQVLVHLGSIWGAGMSRAFATEQDAKGWIIPVAVQAIPAIILLIGVPFCIESPRWLIAHGMKNQAIENMNKIRPVHDREGGQTILEVEGFEMAIEESKKQNQGTWKELFGRTYINRAIVSTACSCSYHTNHH